MFGDFPISTYKGFLNLSTIESITCKALVGNGCDTPPPADPGCETPPKLIAAIARLKDTHADQERVISLASC